MITLDTSLGELGELMVSHEIEIRKIEKFRFRGWTVEMQHKKGIFEVRDVPSLADALQACFQKVLQAPERKPKESIEKLAPAKKAAQDSIPKDATYATLQRADALEKDSPTAPTHMKVTYGDAKNLRSLCGAVYGDRGKYSDTSEGVTCLRCSKMLQKSIHPTGL